MQILSLAGPVNCMQMDPEPAAVLAGDITVIELGDRQDIISIIEASSEKLKSKEGYIHLGKV